MQTRPYMTIGGLTREFSKGLYHSSAVSDQHGFVVNVFDAIEVTEAIF
jgi:hypothetical protein